jgi:pyruvate dehydrogenase E2 component (dihydrolipoamide acetyltransferase)
VTQDVTMPQMGESIAEGTITTWLKKVGDQVARDEPLFEISTDKVDAEIPSPVAGTLLEIKVQPGDTVPIGSIVAVIGDAAEAGHAKPAPPPPAPAQETKVPDAAPVQRPAAAAPAPVHASAAPASGPAAKSSPVVKKIAAAHQVDLGALSGSGLGGRITKQDIMAHLDAPAVSTGHPAPAPAAAPARPAAQLGMTASFTADIPESYRPRAMEGDRVEELSAMRAKIAEHMVFSRRISAHVGTVWEVDYSRIAKLRTQHKASWEQQHGVNLTYTAFIMKATVDALNAFPMLNASIDGTKVIMHRDVNLGLAVSLDWGLIVPVVHGAGELSLLGMAKRAVDLAGRARSKKLKPQEVQSGTFTISNPGNLGAMFNVPVINQPQVAILGVGSIEKRPVVVDDAIAIRTRGYLSLSFDHRLIDGAIADQFMLRIKQGLENFDASTL